MCFSYYEPMSSPQWRCPCRARAVSVVQGLIVCELNQIPNQPIRFAGEESGRSDDSLIAKTWEIFVDTREAYALGT